MMWFFQHIDMFEVLELFESIFQDDVILSAQSLVGDASVVYCKDNVFLVFFNTVTGLLDIYLRGLRGLS